MTSTEISAQKLERKLTADNFSREVRSHADAIYAVPQPEAWQLQSDGTISSRKYLKYQYKSFTKSTEIRLIRLKHARDSSIKLGNDALPECEVFHADLNHLPRYETISYAWGLLHDTMPICINGEYCLEVTKGLWSAIDVFRHRTKPMVLWADQICINQHDLSERHQQVALMHRIYSQAQHTLVWLGPVDFVADRAFQFIDNVAELKIDQHTAWAIGREIIHFGEDIALGRHQLVKEFLNRERSGLRALSEMLQRPWFTRMWCFQEVVVSKSVIYFCGPCCCSLKDLYKAVGFCIEATETSLGWSTTSQTLQSRDQYLKGNSVQLIELLQRTASCQCTDPRDKIYAVLNVQSNRDPLEIPTDYTKTVRDVYINTTSQIIAQTQALNIFGLRRENMRTEIPELPSWVPDFSLGEGPVSVDQSSSPIFSSCRNRLFSLRSTPVLGQLDVRGKIVDRISGKLFHDFDYSQLDDSFSIDRMFPTLLEILKRRLPPTSGATKTRIDSVTEKLLRTLTLDRCGKWNRGQSGFTDTEIEETLNALQSPMPAQLGIDPWIHNFRSETLCCKSRALLALEKHQVALGPKTAALGDLVCILDGSSVPCVLRKKGHYFELVGQCFVDGIMYGEAVNWKEEEGDTFMLV